MKLSKRGRGQGEGNEMKLILSFSLLNQLMTMMKGEDKCYLEYQTRIKLKAFIDSVIRRQKDFKLAIIHLT